MSPLLTGLVIGFSIAVPVGPIGLLCIRRAITQGRVAGFASGLGAATSDAAFGLIAALGLTAIASALLEHRTWLQLIGGLFLVWLGISTLRSRPPAGTTNAPASRNLAAAYGSTFVLTLTNPMTILSFLGIFAGAGLGVTKPGAMAGAMMVVGVFLGSAAWWLILSSLASWLGGRLETRGLRALNTISGLVIAGFGLVQLAQLAR